MLVNRERVFSLAALSVATTSIGVFIVHLPLLLFIQRNRFHWGYIVGAVFVRFLVLANIDYFLQRSGRRRAGTLLSFVATNVF